MKKSEPTIIVDSSVFAKWFLLDEKERENALHIKEDYVDEQITICLPSIAFYEVNNVFRSAVLRKRMSAAEALENFHIFLQFDFASYALEEFQEEILAKAIDRSMSSYDASYIVLAEYLKIPFFTADEKLLQKVSSKYIRHLKDYPRE